METEMLNLDQICRTCKCASPEMVSLFENCECSNQNFPIDEMLTACTSVQVMFDDGLPAQICHICLNQLKSAFTFKLQCEKVDSYLRDHANNVKVEEIKPEEEYSTFKQPNHDNYNQIQEENVQKLFRCSACSDVVTIINGKSVCGCDRSSHNVQQHDQAHSGKNVYVCKICSKKLARKDFLKGHLVTHLKKKPFSCKTCNRVYNGLQSLKCHTNKCKRDVVYPCHVCNKAFSQETSLEDHMKLHDDEPKLPTIETLDNFEEYYYQIDQDAATVVSDCSEINDFESVVDVTEHMVDIKTEAEADLSFNCDEASAFNCNLDDPLKNGGVLVKVEDNVDYSDCLENGDVQVELEDPLETVDDVLDDDKSVDEGNRGFHKVSNLTAHEKYHPREKTRHLCSTCSKEFVTADNLRSHRRTHTGERPHQCTYCDAAFAQGDDLKAHVRKHKTRERYQCDLCSKTFVMGYKFTQHKRTVHGLNVVSRYRRLQPAQNDENSDDAM